MGGQLPLEDILIRRMNLIKKSLLGDYFLRNTFSSDTS